jgi:multidrug efflux pump subunit AcrB
VSSLTRFNAPTEVDHNQIRRKMDIYIRPQGEDLGAISKAVEKILATATLPKGLTAAMSGSVKAMNESFRSFAIGLTLSVLLF